MQRIYMGSMELIMYMQVFLLSLEMKVLKGVEKIEEIDLNENEKTEFNNSVEAVIKLWDAASKIDPDLNKD